MASQPLFRGLLAAVMVGSVAANTMTSHFQDFYPDFGGFFKAYIEGECQTDFQHYLNGDGPNAVCRNCLSNVVSDCLLNASSENMKANMASAAVMLGLLPSILSMAGSSTVESGLLSIRRPFLSFLLAAGAPAVSPIRSIDYVSPTDILVRRADSLRPLRFGPLNMIVSLIEYLLAAAAAANLAHVSYQLGRYTVATFATTEDWLPALWSFVAILIHIAGVISLRLRIKALPSKGEHGKRSWLREELTLSTDIDHQRWLQIQFRRESYAFVFISWFTGIGVIIHLLFGTLVFSSLLFISTIDTLTVAFRFLASTIVCRAILKYEISGMRYNVSVVEPEEMVEGNNSSAEEMQHLRAN